jgi:uncharacterized protein (TIGR02246 family)
MNRWILTWLSTVLWAGRLGAQSALIADHHQHLISPAIAGLLATDSGGPETITAPGLVALLDSAGIRGALLPSVAYMYGSPRRTVEDEYTARGPVPDTMTHPPTAPWPSWRSVLYGSDAAIGEDLRPRESWSAFRRLPLTDGELARIARNVAPHLREDVSTAVPAAASDTTAIQELARQFSAAYVRGDADAMTALYTTDAVLFPERSAAITGRDAIRRYWTLPRGRRVTRHVLSPARITVDGRHAYDHGTFEIAGERDGVAWGPFHGKYVVVWRREGGAWRMHLDMWNSGPDKGGL